MKKTILFAALAIVLLACTGTQVSDVQVGPYTVSVISDGVYHIQDCNDQNPAGETFDESGAKTHFNNCSDIYLVVGSEEALLIDLSNRIDWADNAEESLRSIVAERAADKPLAITFTHNHGDHTGMLPAFIEDPNVHFVLPGEDFYRMFKQFPEDTELIDEGYVFDLGGKQVETVLVPGHTAGSAVFFLKGEDIVFTGDAIGSGHGVWIFDAQAFDNYLSAIPHLISYIKDPANGVNEKKLKIYSGHYWQKDWLNLKKGQELGMNYILQMQQLLGQMAEGTAATEPSNLGRPNLDTYFRNGDAIITWSADQAKEYFSRYAEKEVFRNEDIVIRQIDDHTWEGNGHLCYNESIYILEGDESTLVIDAGTIIKDLDKIVSSISDKPAMLVATHVHPDHTGSAVNCFPELWINAADTVNVPVNAEYTCELKYLTDGQIIDLGGRKIEVMFTPGHTPGSTTFFDCDAHYGFSGDAFGSTNLLLTTSFSTLIATTTRTAEYMQAHGIEKLFPGHYGGNNPETLQRVLDEKKMSEEMLAGTRHGDVQEGMLGLNAAINDYGVTIRYRDPDGLK